MDMSTVVVQVTWAGYTVFDVVQVTWGVARWFLYMDIVYFRANGQTIFKQETGRWCKIVLFTNYASVQQNVRQIRHRERIVCMLLWSLAPSSHKSVAFESY